ncbi:M48 family metallopeptidase [soil metagenome]
MKTPTSTHRLSIVLTVFAAIFLLSGCATYRQLELKGANLAFSGEQEKQLGDEYAAEITKQVPNVDDATLNKWVNDMGQKLVQNSPPCDQTFVFSVADTEAVNAFAIPGGHCFVNIGLLRIAENEAEVAAVVGHEINHVTQRHGMRSIERQTGMEYMAQALSGSQGAATVVNLVKQSGGLLAMRGFSRSDEREADHYGVEAMYKAGFDPRMAVTFFEKLSAGEQGGMSKFAYLLATHPTTPERIQNIKDQIATYDLNKPMVVNSPEFLEVKRIVAARPIGKTVMPE